MASSLGRSWSLCLSLCIFVCLSDCRPPPPVPVKMTETINTLLKQQGRSDIVSPSGSPVFSRDLLNGMEDEDKRLVLGEMLEVYVKLFREMLSQPQTSSQPEEKRAEGIQYLLDTVGRLKTKEYWKHLLVSRSLEQLGHIQTNSSAVQNKALWELPWLYNEANSLAERKRRSLRRRRAARKRGLPVLTKLRRAI